MSTSKTQYKEAEKTPIDESVLTRWSRRKQLAKQGELDEQKPGSEPTIAAEVKTSEVTEYKTDADMQPIESIDEQSNLSDFFSPKVSEALRKQAFRKLFHLPIYNITDGLNDYDEDYTQFISLGDIVTAEMRHQIRQEAKRALAAADSEEELSKESSTKQADEDISLETNDSESPSRDEIV